MPNYYAHLEFGRHVLEALPTATRRAVAREQDAFLVGLYGPDPLLCGMSRAVRRCGQSICRAAARAPMEQLHRAITARHPMALGYAAGFLCHYALDSACHAPIAAAADRTSLTPRAIAAELDRRLMAQKLLDPLYDTPMPENECPEAVYEAAVIAYPGVSPRQLRLGLACFQKLNRLVTLLSGTAPGARLDGFLARRPALAALQGALLPPVADPASAEICQALECLLRDAIAPTAEQLVLFLNAAPDAACSAYFDLDFAGQTPCAERPRGAAVHAAEAC